MLIQTSKTILVILLPISLLFSSATTLSMQPDSTQYVDTAKKSINIAGSVAKLFFGSILLWAPFRIQYQSCKDNTCKQTIKNLFIGLKTCPFNVGSDNNTYLGVLAPLFAGVELVKNGAQTIFQELNIGSFQEQT